MILVADPDALDQPLQGILYLYRGITPTLLGILPYAGIAFTINDKANHQVRKIEIGVSKSSITLKLCINRFSYDFRLSFARVRPRR